MKVFIVIASFIAVASAGHLHSQLAVGPAAISTGSSSQFRSEDNYGNYNFGYDESHATGGSSRREEQINGVRRGSYSLSDADGRRRTVNYIADATGFHADVQTNEPGVEPKDPADVLINKAAPVAIAGPVAIAAPAPLALPAPAPIAFPAPAPVAPIAVAAPVKGYFAQRAPVAIAAPAPVVVEAETPRAFSYSFGASHVAPAYAAPVLAAPAPLPAPIAGPIAAGPIFQQRLEY